MAHNPCAICYGTGAIRCNHCGGNGLNLDSSLLDHECYGCKGTGSERCQKCQGTGEHRTLGLVAASNTERKGRSVAAKEDYSLW